MVYFRGVFMVYLYLGINNTLWMYVILDPLYFVKDRKNELITHTPQIHQKMGADLGSYFLVYSWCIFFGAPHACSN